MNVDHAAQYKCKEPSRQLPKSYPARFALRAQRVHVLVFNLIPLLFTFVAIARFRYVSLSWFDVLLAVSMWVLTLGLGGTVGFHRYFAHRSFDTSPTMRTLLAIAGSMSAQGPPLSWVCTHRRHHEYSDSSGDPHSPHVDGERTLTQPRGLWHAHCGWLIGHDVPNPQHYCPDLIKDTSLLRVNRLYLIWVALGLLIPTAVSGFWHFSLEGATTGLLWSGFVRMFLTSQFIWSINSICHSIGSRRYSTSEHSRNNAALAIPSFGEAWHNNHHAYPTSARFGLRWWEVDLGFLLILLMKGLGLVWNVRVPASISAHIGSEGKSDD